MAEAIESALEKLCAEELNDLPADIAHAIKYALSGGGKHLRGNLLMACYRAAGDGAAGDPALLAAAVEIIHTYSLVHDDLPCMDNDDFRRGRPSLHRQFGVPAATRSGVVMVPLAVLAATKGAKALQLPREAQHTIVKVLTRSAGASGMIGGQVLDLAAEGRQVGLGELETIHKSKTGALIAASARIGGIAAQAPQNVVEALYQFGERLGHAFQIVDDVLDVTATSERLGKTAGSDVKLGKSTYPALLGVDGARARAGALVADGCNILRKERLLTPELERMAQFVITREF